MEPLELREIARAVRAEYDGGLPEMTINDVCTDSRDVRPGCLFVALSGGKFDGHAFVRAAFERGASWAVVQRDGDYGSGNILKVRTTRQAFLDIAGLYRSKFDIPCVAVTGSVGKTTTREMVYAVLSSRYRTLRTENNQNNEVGVPKTLLSLDRSYEAMVLEFGMQAMGEIRELTVPARPCVGVVTSIGVSHIEQLGSRENILKTKLELTEGMPDGGTLLLNRDNDMLRTLDFPRLNVVFYGIEDKSAGIRAVDIGGGEAETAFGIVWQGRTYRARIPCVGEHNVLNALAGFGAGVALGMEPEECAAALGRFEQTGMRQRVEHSGGVTIVADCYNANPDSMAAALKTLSGWKLAPGAKRIAVLGDMLELGDWAESTHREVGRQAAGVCDALFCCGPLAVGIAEGAREAGLGRVFYENDREALARLIKAEARPGDIVWFKASRGMKFEEIIELCREEA